MKQSTKSLFIILCSFVSFAHCWYEIMVLHILDFVKCIVEIIFEVLCFGWMFHVKHFDWFIHWFSLNFDQSTTRLQIYINCNLIGCFVSCYQKNNQSAVRRENTMLCLVSVLTILCCSVWLQGFSLTLIVMWMKCRSSQSNIIWNKK